MKNTMMTVAVLALLSGGVFAGPLKIYKCVEKNADGESANEEDSTLFIDVNQAEDEAISYTVKVQKTIETMVGTIPAGCYEMESLRGKPNRFAKVVLDVASDGAIQPSNDIYGGGTLEFGFGRCRPKDKKGEIGCQTTFTARYFPPKDSNFRYSWLEYTEHPNDLLLYAKMYSCQILKD